MRDTIRLLEAHAAIAHEDGDPAAAAMFAAMATLLAGWPYTAPDAPGLLDRALAIAAQASLGRPLGRLAA
jgi:hypothetical protein